MLEIVSTCSARHGRVPPALINNEHSPNILFHTFYAQHDILDFIFTEK